MTAIKQHLYYYFCLSSSSLCLFQFFKTYITSQSSSQTCAISANISDFLSYEFRMRRSGAPSQRIPGGFSGNLPISLSPKTAPTLTSPDALSSPSASKNPRLDSDFNNSSPAPNSANSIGGNPLEVKYVGRSVQEHKHVGHFSNHLYQTAKPQSPLSHQRSPLQSLNFSPTASSQPPPTGAQSTSGMPSGAPKPPFQSPLVKSSTNSNGQIKNTSIIDKKIATAVDSFLGTSFRFVSE